MSLAPPPLKFTAYLMDKFTSWTLNSERFDFKARANEEDLDSRREWHSLNTKSIIGDVFILEPLPLRGRTLGLAIKISWRPCFSTLRWEMGDCFLHVAVRPSPPYRAWVRDNVAPVTWHAAVTHSDRILARWANPQTVTQQASSSSSNHPKAGPPPAPKSVPKNFAQVHCQAAIPTTDGFCQTILPTTQDIGIGPDLIHLETTLAAHHPAEYYHVPWPVVWVAVFDESGVIRETLWAMPTPGEFVVAANVFPPPETTHETVLHAVYNFPADTALPVHPRRPNFRPPPPLFPRPEPPVGRPDYIPIPPGIRAVYTTQAALLRSQPEMNHPRRQIAPAIRNGAAALGDLDIAEIARRWVIRLNNNPEISPTL